jgi:hypothetical protein
MREAKLFSYVVQHDTGHAPNPYFGICTLCRCKYRHCPEKPPNVVELAEPGDWIVGTGGADRKKSAGHHRLVYAMKVEEKMTRDDYFRCQRFACKRKSGSEYDNHCKGDNTNPTNEFERDKQFVLISKRRFYYFGNKAVCIPLDKFPKLEKRGPGFRSDFDEDYIRRFEKWITRYKAGMHGDPCQQQSSKEKGQMRCKSSC